MLALSPVATANPILTDDFERAESGLAVEDLGPGWTTNSARRAGGDKQASLVDGALAIETSPRADHGAVVFYKVDLDDLILSLRFKFERGHRFAVNFSDSRLKTAHAGHVLGVNITPRSLTVEDHMNGKFDKAVYTRRKAGEKMTEADFAAFWRRTTADIAPDVWHDLEVTISGDTITAVVDGEYSVTHASPGFDHPTKSQFSFVVPMKKRVVIDDVRVWSTSERSL